MSVSERVLDGLCGCRVCVCVNTPIYRTTTHIAITATIMIVFFFFNVFYKLFAVIFRKDFAGKMFFFLIFAFHFFSIDLDKNVWQKNI